MIVLDTHVLLWWLTKFVTLPKEVLKKIESHKKRKEILISAITFWEVAMLIKKDRLQLNFDLRSWTDQILTLPFLQIVNPDPWILLESVNHPEPIHSDPADRILVATARHRGALLITKDDKILDYQHVKSFWK